MKYNSFLLKQLFFTVIIFVSTTILAQTPPIVYVSGNGSGDFNCNGTSDQVEINQALDYVAGNSNFTTVYLKGPYTYIIDEPVLISSNTILTGDSTATILLKENANWWTYDKPLISQTGRVGWNPHGDPSESISNVEIYGFTIDGGKLQAEPSGNRYNTLLHFTYPDNVIIHDMHFRNGKWDAIRISSSTFAQINCEVYNNDIFACGHDGISFVGVINCNAHHNKIIRTRTNSGLRATHCNSIFFHHNIVGNSISLPPSGYAGIQIQNTNPNMPCTEADIYENVIYGKTEGIHLGEETNQATYPTGTMKGVHIHHNKVYKTNTITEQITNVTLTGGIVVMGYQNTIIEHNIIDGSLTDGISFRGNTGGGTGYQTVVRNNIIINNQGYGINNEEPTINTFIANNNLVYHNGIGNYNNTTSSNDINSDPMFGKSHSTLNQWYHIVASYDNTTETMKIYINGVEKSSLLLSGFGTIGSNSKNLLLGAIYNLNYWFWGLQDEFALWNKALTTNEISTLYNNGTPVNISGSLTNGLQAYFKMDNNWDDASGNGFHAQDNTAVFTTNTLSGSHSGSFNGSQGVQYPTTLSTSNGLTISTWVYRTSLSADTEIQTIVNKGRMDDFDHIWLYFRGESVLFEIGNGTIREDLEAYITDPEDIDYHVKSEYGRWSGNGWINDTATSPCVDGGYASSDFSNEPTPNGGIVNIGVYGNTTEASKSNTSLSVEGAHSNTIMVFPNPTTDKIYFSKQNINGTYKVFSITGSLVKKGVIKSNFISLSKLKKGIYFIKIIDDETNKTIVAKILKK